MTLRETIDAVLQGGEPLLIASEKIFELQSLISVPQLISELQVAGHFEENSGLPKTCIQYAPTACGLILDDIQRRLAALQDAGHQQFLELKKLLETK